MDDRGIEKLVSAAVMRRGSDSPSVTSVNCDPGRVVVVQPVAPLLVQVEPVKPLVHIQAQDPVTIKGAPPFWHDVDLSAWHCSTADNDALWGLGLLMTSSSRGTTTAAAMTINSTNITRIAPQHGSPQQRLFLEGFCASW